MTKASSAPATKQDIKMIMDEIGKWKDELRLHFDFSVETIRHDLLGINRDEIQGIKTRLTRVEQKVGLAS